jgi:hypothetical protein
MEYVRWMVRQLCKSYFFAFPLGSVESKYLAYSGQKTIQNVIQHKKRGVQAELSYCMHFESYKSITTTYYDEYLTLFL